MTRANFVIITPDGKFKLQANSSAYPSEIMRPIAELVSSVASDNGGATNGFYERPESLDFAKFVEDVGLTLGHVGNPTYFYTIDFVQKRVFVWGTCSRWINAPVDWEAKGWRGVYLGKNGKMGYRDCNIKGKKIFDGSFGLLTDEKNLKGCIAVDGTLINF